MSSATMGMTKSKLTFFNNIEVFDWFYYTRTLLYVQGLVLWIYPLQNPIELALSMSDFFVDQNFFIGIDKNFMYEFCEILLSCN